jgi:Yip1 domain
MSDLEVQPVAEPTPAGSSLSQVQRVTSIFSAPSKTFEDIKLRNRSWWLPFLITILTGAVLYATITEKVTWRQVYENQQREMPEFAKHMVEQQPPEVRAASDARGPMTQAITWALSPLGVLIMNLICAGVLLGTINFGFGGKAKFSSILAVTFYAGLVYWPLKLLLATIPIFTGAAPEAFNIGNPSPTNIGAFLVKQDTPAALYTLATAIDALFIWCLILTSIGVATVAGVKRSSGYMAVFGWWALVTLLFVGIAAAFG